MTRSADVLIVGGGVIGCALARELAGRGLRVTVIERGVLGGEASGAAAGLLTPQAESLARGPLFEVGLESRTLYPQWIGELEEETGYATGYRQTGALFCAFTDAEERRLEEAARWQRGAGLRLDAFDRDAMPRELARHLSDRIRRANFFPEEAFVHCPRLMATLGRSLARRGVAVEHATVTRFRLDSGRCIGVDTTAGAREAGHVVDASGAWAGLECGLPFALPVRPVRGQMIAWQTPDPPPLIVQSESVYVVPRSEGELLAGATVEEAGFRKEVTPEGIAQLAAAAGQLLPALGVVPCERAWAGLRPGSPDGLPYLGESGTAGLSLAVGHFRSGILLAPWTARAVAELILGGRAVPELAPFSIRRIGDSAAFGAARASREAARAPGAA